MRRDRDSLRWVQSVLPSSWPMFCLVVAIAGCEPSAESKLGKTIDAPPPRHPAMATGRLASSTPQAQSQLPAGHPPVGDATPHNHPPAEGGAPKTADLPSTGRVRLGPISFEIPEGLQRQAPSSQMRLAQFRLPPAEGDTEAGLMTVTVVGGGVQGNIDRWRGQFAGGPAAQTEVFEVDSTRIHLVRIEGDYRGMGGGAAKSGFRLWAAIVEQSPQALFFKATGPKATLLRWEAALDSLARSIHIEK